MTDSPLVSVVIPSYNHGRYVQECIQSVIDQDYENIELLIIDDGSSDSSVEKIRSMLPACEKRFVRFEFRSRPNKGVSATLNEAIEWCEGRYFSAIASDDVLLPQKTSVLVRTIEQSNGVAGVFCGYHIIDGDGNRVDALQPQTGTFSFREIILRQKYLPAPTQLLNLECVKGVGGYREELGIEDLYMWLALTEHGDRLMVVDGLLVEYRQHGENYSDNFSQMCEEKIKLLNCFSHNPLFDEAMAVNSFLDAQFLTARSKAAVLKLLFKSFAQYPKIIFHPQFAKSFIRLVTPRFLREWVKKAWAAMPGSSKN